MKLIKRVLDALAWNWGRFRAGVEKLVVDLGFCNKGPEASQGNRYASLVREFVRVTVSI